MKFFVVLLIVAISGSKAFINNWSTHSRCIHLASNNEKSTTNSFWDLLNGNAQVRKERAANPALFQRKAGSTTNKSSPKVKITPVIQSAIDCYKVI